MVSHASLCSSRARMITGSEGGVHIFAAVRPSYLLLSLCHIHLRYLVIYHCFDVFDQAAALQRS